ncbi:Tetratricopeptide repeat protein 15 [Fasciola hepatica]|uniref:Tetratricopeptide repeat protein 15 n=1 Tax=Fasciola hepatica TaxID=6192 RepID=A0A4E0S0K7_FASHE|nr:Tetratricopeptide repeat protein 15 [Fasciola hepatica]
MSDQNSAVLLPENPPEFEHERQEAHFAGSVSSQQSPSNREFEDPGTHSGKTQESSTQNKNMDLSSYFSAEPTQDDPFEAVFHPSASDSKETSTVTVKPPTSTIVPPDAQFTVSKPTVSLDSATLNRLRQRDAWLPSEATRDALLQHSQGQLPTGVPEIRPLLSSRDKTGAVSSGTDSNKLNDPYRALLLNYLSDEATVDALRHVPNPIEQATVGPENLKELITSGWYRVALDVTYRLLSNWGYGEDQGGVALTPFTAQIWLTRFALLVRIRNYEVAERELNTFGTLDAPNVYFESSPDLYPGRSGSIIPFSLRLVHAELPFYLGRSEEALDRLYHLIATIGRIQNNLRNGFTEDGSMKQPEPSYKEASLNIWIRREVRVLSSCLSIYLSELDYQAAIDTVHQLAISCSSSPGVLRGLASIMGRIYLQMGDLETARTYFERALLDSDSRKQPVLGIQKLLNQAFMCIGRNEYEEAMKLFQQVLDLDPTNVAAANDMAVCGLYLGQLATAIRLLETLNTTGLTGAPIRLDATHVLPGAASATGVGDPNKSISHTESVTSNSRRFCLHDTLVFNLAVFYEVESERATTKKLRLLEHLASLPGEPVNVSAVKLPMQSS